MRLPRQLIPGTVLAVVIGALAWVLFRVLPMTAIGTLVGLAATLMVFAAAALVVEWKTVRLVFEAILPGVQRSGDWARPVEAGSLTEVPQ
jgi:hypothetical protein